MADAEQIRLLRKELLSILGRHPSRLSQLISETIKDRGPMKREEATLLVAHERGIDISKYANSDDLATVRTLTPRKQMSLPGKELPPIKKLPGKKKGQRPKSRDVFVVHGRGEAIKKRVTDYLRELGLSPVVLNLKPNRGRTIIEKLEHYSSVACAVILLTPDDHGSIRRQQAELQPRARQNVIFELGYFVGLLGREYVCALYKEGVELPSDIHGVLYTPLNREWKPRLRQELKAMGLDVKNGKS